MKVKKVRQYSAIGIMSGTSLDGVDLAHCRFNLTGTSWKFSILHAVTIPYTAAWKSQLSSAHELPTEMLLTLHAAFGKFLGEQCRQFMREKKIKNLDLVASHGHTIFHQPASGLTYQLGDGNALHAVVGVPVVCDFRSLDVQLGGEGAPLVPVGDLHLFSHADVCLNLGGISNLSLNARGKRIAFDICFCNMMLNHLAAKAGRPFDDNGSLARSGKVQAGLLAAFEKKYRATLGYPSLAREGFEKDFQSLLDNDSFTIEDRLRTVCESIASEISRAIPGKKKVTLLATGGGALNEFLMERISSRLEGRVRVTVPDADIINFKEAMVFAFLGVLRVRGEVNVLKRVTGASRDSCSGVLIG